MIFRAYEFYAASKDEEVVVAEYDGPPDRLARVRVAAGTGRFAGS